MAKEICLPYNRVALIDDEDYEIVSKLVWRAFTIGYRRKTTYAITFVKDSASGKRKMLSMHRYLMEPFGNEVIQHLNRDGLDNRRSNLLVTHRKSLPKIARGWKGKRFKGVFTDPRAVKRKSKYPYETKIMIDGKQRFIGSYSTLEEAAKVYDFCARLVFGKTAVLNFPGNIDYEDVIISPKAVQHIDLYYHGSGIHRWQRS